VQHRVLKQPQFVRLPFSVMMMAQDFKASAVLAGMHVREKPEPAVENAKAKSSEGCGLSANAVILIGAAIVALAADQ
jgi:hypothetical protein